MEEKNIDQGTVHLLLIITQRRDSNPRQLDSVESNKFPSSANSEPNVVLSHRSVVSFDAKRYASAKYKFLFLFPMIIANSSFDPN